MNAPANLTPFEPHRHFKDRVLQRFGRDVDATALWVKIVLAFDADDRETLSFMTRLRRDGTRLFMIRLEDGRPVFVIMSGTNPAPLTVFPEGFAIRRQGRRPYIARDPNTQGAGDALLHQKNSKKKAAP